ncbi:MULTISPECIES: DRTGG domain-containing protein [Carboxydocella]|uniref:Predicted transcriptional regulator containing CBS domains n=2 Tax=Carboxydocella TaxID=178898 RepID=A0A1T4LBE9_9FIRM|nr:MULTISPECIES: DRTGG domain-containing protein [Carboxydocella]AVX19868.1 putative transcriptional regulator [Carboxydocella thermautotrophica]AVX30277.1 putative transcriptional regulator [Carboxydocella thermautotrophica]GAW30538.1 transcriptional regulator [Carboxydocella sp. JDF658]SJZ51986.1 Predicted transcriptional regulator containing CBS domains [Carboxydocella sporoproducens DSM 16521]
MAPQTKHEQILQYIEALPVGTKVSVRRIARELEVSDGTAYRAIKEAEAQGLVSSIPKVGTVRIETPEAREIEDLTLAEIKRLVEGTVLTGEEYLSRGIKAFTIGASTVDVLPHYVEEGSVFIVGNRTDAQRAALELGAHLLIIGGFTPEEEIIQLARQKNRAVISTPYDTFAVTSIINRALLAAMPDKEIVLVEDAMVREFRYLKATDRIADWHAAVEKYHHSRFPVLNEAGEVIGLVTPVDVFGREEDEPISAVMRPAVTVEQDVSIGHAARLMIWEGQELLPVVDDRGRAVGVLSRQDIINAYQHLQKQPHITDTLDNIVLSGFRMEDTELGVKLLGEITEFMTNEFGFASVGVLVTLINSTAYIALKRRKRLDLSTESLTLLHIEPVPFDQQVEVEAAVLSTSRRVAKIEVTVRQGEQLVAKAFITGKNLER